MGTLVKDNIKYIGTSDKGSDEDYLPMNKDKIELTLYDPSGSSSGTKVACCQDFCIATHGGVIPSCVPATPCQYNISYGDGNSTTGFFVTDFLQYNQVSGNSQTTLANTSITFGCGAKIGGDLGSSSQALDGILGFGQSNSSMLSQLAAAGKVRKVFAHCLDTINGEGISAIGDVVQPKVSTTPLVPGMMSGSEDSQNNFNVTNADMDTGTGPERTPSDPGTPSSHGFPKAATRSRRKINYNEEDVDFIPEGFGPEK
ncbi:Aspartic proteinase-like protein 2 [Hordeum vulgare]|nr:Aspartic proteinase-like protein 2 [Hordeum vulgare]